MRSAKLFFLFAGVLLVCAQLTSAQDAPKDQLFIVREEVARVDMWEKYESSPARANAPRIWPSSETEALVARMVRRPLAWRSVSTSAMPSTTRTSVHSTIGTVDAGSSYMTVSPQSKSTVG